MQLKNVTLIFALSLIGPVLSSSSSSSSLLTPQGSLVFWSGLSDHADSKPQVHQDTKTAEPSDAARTWKEALQSNGLEAAAFLVAESSSESVLDMEAVVRTIKSSTRYTAMTDIYHQTNVASRIPEHNSLSSALEASMGEVFPKQTVMKLSLPEFAARLMASKTGKETTSSRDRKQLDLFVVDVASTPESERSQLLRKVLALGPSVLLAASREPTRIRPAESAALERRALSSSGSSGPQSGISLWYDETFLYITPGIFTALMSMHFMIVAALIGFCCLSSLQGPGTFVHKGPAVGREG
jgi:hypothetical protein